MIFPTWFYNPEERFSYKEVQLKKFCLPGKTSCASAEIINKIPAMGAKVTTRA